MNAPTQDELIQKKCVPCEGGVPHSRAKRPRRLVRNVSRAGHSTPTARQISRSWTMKNFMAGIEFFDKVAELAEDEGHHPDLHLEGYRKVTDRPDGPTPSAASPKTTSSWPRRSTRCRLESRLDWLRFWVFLQLSREARPCPRLSDGRGLTSTEFGSRSP